MVQLRFFLLFVALDAGTAGAWQSDSTVYTRSLEAAQRYLDLADASETAEKAAEFLHEFETVYGRVQEIPKELRPKDHNSPENVDIQLSMLERASRRYLDLARVASTPDETKPWLQKFDSYQDWAVFVLTESKENKNLKMFSEAPRRMRVEMYEQASERFLDLANASKWPEEAASYMEYFEKYDKRHQIAEKLSPVHHNSPEGMDARLSLLEDASRRYLDLARSAFTPDEAKSWLEKFDLYQDRAVSILADHFKKIKKNKNLKMFSEASRRMRVEMYEQASERFLDLANASKDPEEKASYMEYFEKYDKRHLALDWMIEVGAHLDLFGALTPEHGEEDYGEESGHRVAVSIQAYRSKKVRWEVLGNYLEVPLRNKNRAAF